MEIEKMKTETFPKASFEEWANKAKESLKGKSFESLYKNTYEKVLLKPLYDREDVDGENIPQYPGLPDYRRGIDAPGRHENQWHVANKISYSDAENLMDNIRSALLMGQTALAFEIKPSLFSSGDKLKDVLAACAELGPFSINAGGFHKPFLAHVMLAGKETGKNGEIDGFIASDPIAEAACTGFLQNGEIEFFKHWEPAIKYTAQHLPKVKTVLVNTAPYHNSGANAIQELAIAISTGVFYLQHLLDKGWIIDDALDKLIFHFSIGANFFMETAKLRAVRILWDKAMEAYGAVQENRKMIISAETSSFTKTVFDPYVNLLRAGNEAFAAVLGGVKYLDVHPFNETIGQPTPFSERIARNTQLILKTEAHLEKVYDPAGGSWYIEALTKGLAEQAWAFFLELEDQGGILEALKKEWLQDKLLQLKSKREDDVLTRKQSIVGTNVYANLSDKADRREAVGEAAAAAPGSIEEIIDKAAASEPVLIDSASPERALEFKPIRSARLSEPFENLRYKSARIERVAGRKPSIGLIALGELKEHKSRVDFISGFMAAGGIQTIKSSNIMESKDAIEFIKSAGITHFCLCGDDRQYEERGPGLIKDIKAVFPKVKLSLAGLPEDRLRKRLIMEGIEKYIHVKSNSYEILSNLLQELEEAINESKA